MSTQKTRNLSVLRKPGLFAAAAAASALVAVGVPLAMAAPPTATPPSDVQGYVESTARCTAPDTAVLFGTTDSSRIAICKTASGSYEYRGVRVRDGAKLIAPATATSSDSFTVSNDGSTYTITPTALSVTVGGSTVRTESWTDFHSPLSPASGTGTGTGTGTATTKPTTSGSATATATTSAKPSTSGTASPTTSGAVPSTATKQSAAPASSAQASSAPVPSAPPLPPPLPAEVGGGSSASR